MNYNPYQQYPYQQHTYSPQTTYLPLTFVNGIEGAKAFIVGANQTVYLKDSDSNMLYEKKADSQGRYSIIAYELKQVESNQPKTDYVTMDVFTKTIEELKAQLGGIVNEPTNK
jgi:hypothetical protein